MFQLFFIKICYMWKNSIENVYKTIEIIEFIVII